MITVRQIERQWENKAYQRLAEELLSARSEGSLPLSAKPAPALASAALGVIRLHELDQPQARLCSNLVKTIVAAQQADGGWGELFTSAMCIRALLCGNGNGAAIDRGLSYLAALQKPEGIWPAIPIRRMPGDPHVSALVLYELADQPRFRRAVRFADAVGWFISHFDSLDESARQVWRRARVLRGLDSTVQPSLC